MSTTRDGDPVLHARGRALATRRRKYRWQSIAETDSNTPQPATPARTKAKRQVRR
jgi:hypothetical protein